MYAKFKKSVPFNYRKGHVLCIQFSLPSWSLFQLSHALGERLWCFVMQHRGETGTCSKQAGSVVCLGTSVFKHQKYLLSSFPVTKICHLCNTETLGDTKFYWDFKKKNKPTQLKIPPVFSTQKRVKGTGDLHLPPLIYSTPLQGWYKLEFSIVLPPPP